jgi:hypothetical protein
MVNHSTLSLDAPSKEEHCSVTRRTRVLIVIKARKPDSLEFELSSQSIFLMNDVWIFPKLSTLFLSYQSFNLLFFSTRPITPLQIPTTTLCPCAGPKKDEQTLLGLASRTNSNSLSIRHHGRVHVQATGISKPDMFVYWNVDLSFVKIKNS